MLQIIRESYNAKNKFLLYVSLVIIGSSIPSYFYLLSLFNLFIPSVLQDHPNQPADIVDDVNRYMNCAKIHPAFLYQNLYLKD